MGPWPSDDQCAIERMKNEQKKQQQQHLKHAPKVHLFFVDISRELFLVIKCATNHTLPQILLTFFS